MYLDCEQDARVMLTRRRSVSCQSESVLIRDRLNLRAKPTQNGEASFCYRECGIIVSKKNPFVCQPRDPGCICL